ncbi:MAG: molybdenum cofactor biosynthesis protein MoaB [Caldilineaceae bacterium]|nr:molybdenum cofactor biosynthesis protein MoaB [Caldilineaceae bacterium]MDE0338690.1 molybdenum cofactor biosynthesis protein MoaB [Caldilineaceae bacterium]
MQNGLSSEEHRRQAEEEKGSIAFAIVTVSDTRTPETDRSGQAIRQMAEAEGHQVIASRIVPDEPEQVSAALKDFSGCGAQVIIFNGGTGVSKRDRTYDVLSQALEKELPGFGEIFRMLSYDEVGAAAMLSRATAGTYRGCAIISVPGSTNAVKLAMEKLVLPEIQHLAWEITR